MALPLAEGGLNFPSLIHRKAAYNLKFLGDLTQGDQTIPWKAWTHANLRQASTARPSTRTPNPSQHAPWDRHLNLDPILQHTYTKYHNLEPHVQHTIRAARQACVNVQSCAPSAQARSSALATYHHALSGSTLHSDLEARGITTVGKLVCPTVPRRQAAHFVCSMLVEYTTSKDKNTNPFCVVHWEAPAKDQAARERLLGSLLLTDWHPQLGLQVNNQPQGKLTTWQNQADIRDCICIHTGLPSILAPRSSTAGLSNSCRPKLCFIQAPDWRVAQGPLAQCTVHVYTDGSAMNNNSPAKCISATAWVSDTGGSDH